MVLKVLLHRHLSDLKDRKVQMVPHRLGQKVHLDLLPQRQWDLKAQMVPLHRLPLPLLGQRDLPAQMDH